MAPKLPPKPILGTTVRRALFASVVAVGCSSDSGPTPGQGETVPPQVRPEETFEAAPAPSPDAAVPEPDAAIPVLDAALDAAVPARPKVAPKKARRKTRKSRKRDRERDEKVPPQVVYDDDQAPQLAPQFEDEHEAPQVVSPFD